MLQAVLKSGIQAECKKSGKLYFSYFACRFTFYIVKLAYRHIYDALYSNVWLKCTNSSHTFLSDEADWLILNIAVADIVRKNYFFTGTIMTMSISIIYVSICKYIETRSRKYIGDILKVRLDYHHQMHLFSKSFLSNILQRKNHLWGKKCLTNFKLPIG